MNEAVSVDHSLQAEKKKLKIVCAWCKKDLGEKDGDIEGVTHSVCEECRDEVFKDITKLKGVDV